MAHDLRDKEGGFAPGPVIIANMALTASFLRPHWFLVLFIAVTLVEFIVLSFFLKNIKTGLRVSVVSNILSSRLAVPFLFFPGVSVQWAGEDTLYTDYSLLLPLVFTFSFYKPVPREVPAFSFFIFYFWFILALVLSILFELLYPVIAVRRSSNSTLTFRQVFFGVTLANAASYAAILLTMMSLGLIAGLSPVIQDPVSFFSGWLFVPEDSLSPSLAGLIDSYVFFLFRLSPVLAVGAIMALIYLVGKERRDLENKGSQGME